MKVKLLMNWDIKADRQQEYFEFVVREWVPGMQRLGRSRQTPGTPCTGSRHKS